MVDGLKFLLTSCYTPLNEGFCILIPFIYSLFKHLQYYCYYDMYRDLGRLGLYIWAAFLASSFAYWEEHWFAYWEEHWLWVQATLPRSRGDHSGLSPRLFQPQAPNIDHLFVNCETILTEENQSLVYAGVCLCVVGCFVREVIRSFLLKWEPVKKSSKMSSSCQYFHLLPLRPSTSILLFQAGKGYSGSWSLSQGRTWN